jgi:hypothetical protein
MNEENKTLTITNKNILTSTDKEYCYDYGYNNSIASTWEDVLKNISPYTVDLGDEKIKEKVAEKINEILNEDGTIEIMKKYLLKFIEENIENPENLVKDLLLERDEELNKCKKELEDCKKDIKRLEEQLRQVLGQLMNLYPKPLGIYGDYPISWTNSSSTVPPIIN